MVKKIRKGKVCVCAIQIGGVFMIIRYFYIYLTTNCCLGIVTCHKLNCSCCLVIVTYYKPNTRFSRTGAWPNGKASAL